MHKQIEWVREAVEPEQTFRRMVVGWQTVLATVNATVLLFNSEYLKSELAKNANPHQGMKEIAIKKIVIGSLREIYPQLAKWYNELKSLDALSEASVDEKKRVKSVVTQVEKLNDIRNLAFHYSDPVEPTESLLQLYEEIDGLDITFLNRVLRDLISLGNQLKEDALVRC